MSDNMCELRAQLEEEYHPKCSKAWKAYEECGERLEAQGNPDGKHCDGWYGDYVHCLDGYVSVSIFFLFYLGFSLSYFIHRSQRSYLQN